jgi:hypothetical protein
VTAPAQAPICGVLDLGVLKHAALVLDERRGQSIIYSLNTTVFQDVVSWAMGVWRARAGRAQRAGSRGQEGPMTNGDWPLWALMVAAFAAAGTRTGA